MTKEDILAELAKENPDWLAKARRRRNLKADLIYKRKHKMEKIINELIEHLSSLKGSAPINHGDLSDLGNEIGIVIGKYTNDKMGYEKDDFVSGIYHGISISDGTHRF